VKINLNSEGTLLAVIQCLFEENKSFDKKFLLEVLEKLQMDRDVSNENPLYFKYLGNGLYSYEAKELLTKLKVHNFITDSYVGDEIFLTRDGKSYVPKELTSELKALVKEKANRVLRGSIAKDVLSAICETLDWQDDHKGRQVRFTIRPGASSFRVEFLHNETVLAEKEGPILIETLLSLIKETEEIV
jgi:hypothetical protein